MAVDRFDVEEIISNTDPNAIRFCPIHKLPHSPDARIYHLAGRACPEGGERLIGVLARWREQDGSPEDMLPPEFWEAMG